MIRIDNKIKRKLQNNCFVDLFCGIGGFHLALSSFGAKCVFASDTDDKVRELYYTNFGLHPQGDIRGIDNESIPSHDILCAGFPCQSFSISGTQAGFSDKKIGTLFFEITRIAEFHRPKLILLENVANLATHDKGKSIKRIIDELSKIGYQPFYKVLNALDFNIPQCRKRLYIIAFRNDLNVNSFHFPESHKITRKLRDILLDDNNVPNTCYVYRTFSLRDGYEKFSFSRQTPYIRVGEIGQGRQGERIYSINGCATTLSASGGGLGGRTGLYLVNGKIRKLAPRECARLMGFPGSFITAKTNNQAYKQFGNSVVIDVLQHIIIEALATIKGDLS